MKTLLLLGALALSTNVFAQAANYVPTDSLVGINYNGTYKYESSYAGSENGAGAFNGNGEVVIENFKEFESFAFAINVFRNYNGEYAFEGAINGVAEFRSDNVASFSGEDCEELLFIITTERVEIIERNCDSWHGARISFDNIYNLSH